MSNVGRMLCTNRIHRIQRQIFLNQHNTTLSSLIIQPSPLYVHAIAALNLSIKYVRMPFNYTVQRQTTSPAKSFSSYTANMRMPSPQKRHKLPKCSKDPLPFIQRVPKNPAHHARSTTFYQVSLTTFPQYTAPPPSSAAKTPPTPRGSYSPSPCPPAQATTPRPRPSPCSTRTQRCGHQAH